MNFSMFLVFPGILITIGVVLLLLSIILVIIAYKTAGVEEPKPSQLHDINYVNPQNDIDDYINDYGNMDNSTNNDANSNINENTNNNINDNTNYNVNDDMNANLNNNVNENTSDNNLNENINNNSNNDINNGSVPEESFNFVPNDKEQNLEETKIFKFPNKLEPNENETFVKPEITNTDKPEEHENEEDKIDIFEKEFNSFEEKPSQETQKVDNQQEKQAKSNDLYQTEEDEEEIEIL